ncbi:hypothetical protein TNIN_413501 [Trichonephila inaurata madagascariensis]|uniref:Uncharacterized protein n=1 Tax=Trichonephila inaurata madagascariensis TaxID=2747483 RepID=A0A8X6YG84_9ARAC|nr:hypothetical protein TNIN_413501 [Trichonephila inaurata madagascariensis]
MLAKVIIFCTVVAAAYASVLAPAAWGAPVLAAEPWGLAGKGLYGAGYLGNGVIAGNGILANGLVPAHGLAAPWGGLVGAPLGVAKVGLGAPLLGLGKVW